LHPNKKKLFRAKAEALKSEFQEQIKNSQSTSEQINLETNCDSPIPNQVTTLLQNEFTVETPIDLEQMPSEILNPSNPFILNSIEMETLNALIATNHALNQFIPIPFDEFEEEFFEDLESDLQ